MRDRGSPVILTSHDVPHVFEFAHRIHTSCRWHESAA
jgi:hypothetical protein